MAIDDDIRERLRHPKQRPGPDGIYRDISVSQDGATLVAVRVARTSNVWSVSVEGDPAPRQLSFGSAEASQRG